MKPIKSATIYFRNDPSVGIHPATFQMELYYDPQQLDDPKAIDWIREKIADLYEFTEGEKPTCVRFDFEIESENRADDERFACPCGEDH